MKDEEIKLLHTWNLEQILSTVKEQEYLNTGSQLFGLEKK